MNYARLLIVTAILSQSAIAEEMSPQERCSKLGDISKQASQMRLDGKGQDEALEVIQQTDIEGLPDDMVKGAVTISYLAKMKPDAMREYYISECEKDIRR